MGGAWTIVYARDARVFVIGYAPPKSKREDYWHCYLQTVLWHREREQWEMPYRYNEFEKPEEAAREGTLADRPAADPGAQELWARAKSIAAELGEAVAEWNSTHSNGISSGPCSPTWLNLSPPTGWPHTQS